MTKYLLRRLLHGLISVVIVVALVMIMVYALIERDLIFAADPVFSHQNNNQKTTYKYRKWEEYGYLDYVPYAEWLKELVQNGEIDEETREAVVSFGKTPDKDSDEVAEYVQKFYDYYESRGYTVVRMDAVILGRKTADGGQQQLFAYRDIPLYKRLWTYFTGLFTVDNIHSVEEDVGERGLTFTLHDPAYGGEKFAPAILGNGTQHKYLLYFDSQFPYIHQNFITLNLGKSYSVNSGVDVFTTMTRSQGSYVLSTVTYPTGLVEQSADDLHTATYVAGSLQSSMVYETRYVDDYTLSLIHI